MLTNRQAIYLYRQFVEDRSGKLSDNSFNNPLAILEYLRLVRATVVKEYLKAGMELPTQMYQTIDCLKLVETDLNECPTQPDSGCYWLKSTSLLPSYIQLTNVSAGVAGTTETYDPTTWDKLHYKAASRVVGKTYTTKDSGKGTHLYIYNNDFLKSISVTGIFDNPEDASQLCDANCLCDILDTSFYSDRNIFNVILEKAWGTLPQVQALARQNLRNDGNAEDLAQ